MKTPFKKIFDKSFEKYFKYEDDKRNKIELNFERIFKNRF